MLSHLSGSFLFCWQEDPHVLRVFVQPQDRRSFKNGYQIAIRVQPILLRCFNEAVDDGAALSAQRGIGKEKILAANDEGLDAALRPVVAQLQPPVLQIADKVWPLLPQVMKRFTQGAFGGRRAGNGIRP